MRNSRPYNSTIIDEKNNKIETIPIEREHVIDIYTEDNKHAVCNICPNKVMDPIRGVPQELRDMSLEELRELVVPNQTLNQLRLRFWSEYDRVIGLGKSRMKLSNIINGICSEAVFTKIMWNRKKMAWILTPVSAYSIGVEELMETTLYKLRKKIDDVDIDSTKDLSVLLKIFETFDKRVHGDYKQTKEITVKEDPQNSSDIRRAINAKKDLLIE